MRIICLGFFLLFAPKLFADIPRAVWLQAGEVRVIKMADVEQVAIGSDGIAQYKPLDNGQFIIIGVAPGETTLQVWRTGGKQHRINITVSREDLSKTFGLAKQLSQSVPGLKVRMAGNRVVFEGEIDERYERTYATLLGEFSRPIDLVQFRTFENKPIIRMDVKVIELRKRLLSQLGIRWDQGTSGPIVGVQRAFRTNDFYRITRDDANGLAGEILEATPNTTGFFSYAGITATLGSIIDLFAENGDAVILAAPKLSVKSGETANFLSGGSFPIPVVDGFGQTSVEFRDYGVILDILPDVDADGVINTQVTAEVSAIDFAVQVGDIPGLTNRRSSTTVNLNNGDTFAISGLAAANSSKQISKVPFFGDLPIIGGFFRSTDKSFDTTELVILITPYVIDAESEANQIMLEESKRLETTIEIYDFDSALME